VTAQLLLADPTRRWPEGSSQADERRDVESRSLARRATRCLCHWCAGSASLRLNQIATSVIGSIPNGGLEEPGESEGGADGRGDAAMNR